MGLSAGIERAELSTGVVLAYTSIGSADSASPVLLLHAWGESRRSFDRLLPLLPDSIRATAIDLRGHGDSDRPTTGYALEELAQDVVAFMDAVGLSSAVLLGSSSGGYLAQEVAVSNPDRVAGLVLVGAPRSLQGRPAFADEVDRLADPVDAAWVRQSLGWFPRFHDVPASYFEDRIEDGTRLPAHVWRDAFYGLTSAVPPTNIATITAPTLIVWGDRDELLDRQQEEALAAAIPRSRLVVYENTGHPVLWEQPERVARDLVEFVGGLPRTTTPTST